MILSSVYTGHGHASIAQSIAEQLDQFDDVRYEVVDGFTLIGKAGIQISKIYGPITRNARDLWKMTYALSDHYPRALTEAVTAAIHDRFLQKLSQFMPDLILTVHSLFNGSVIDLLSFYGLDIPVYVLQADIINIHGSWCDPRAALTLCPTHEAYDSSIQRGMPEQKLKLCGFPTRAQFTEAARAAKPGGEYDGTRALNCLMMSGGEGSGNMLRYARCLLKHVDMRLTIICGRNERLKATLEQELSEYRDRLTVHGFLTNVHEPMLKSDLVIARGSPNTLMEAVVLNVPLLITGALPGQEAENPAVMVAHGLGVVCEHPESAPAIVNTLMRDGGKRLQEIRAAQRAYRNLDNAKDIAELLRAEAMPCDRATPRKRMMLLRRAGGRASKPAAQLGRARGLEE